MTDKEIIKALECHSLPNKCNECPYDGLESGYCSTTMIKNALVLIRRQQAEINQFSDIGKMYSEVKADVIREFAEAMKKELQNVAKVEIMGCEYYLIGLPFIDNLVITFGRKANKTELMKKYCESKEKRAKRVLKGE